MTYDVFLSHNSADKPAVLELAKRLKAAGVEPFLDSWHLVPGEPWQEALETAIDVSRTCAVFVGPSGFGTWENEEMRAALSRRAHNQEFRVIPVILPGAVLPARGRLPAFLSRLTWVDFRPGLDDEAAFDRLVNGIRGLAPSDDGAERQDADEIECPFRGLEVFDEEHARFFFGREALTQYLVEQLRTDRFLAVVGASGSGKSSVVRAGLVPHIRAGDLIGSAKWPIVITKPGPHPQEALASGLAAALAADRDPLVARPSILAGLLESERGLHTVVQTTLGTAGADARVLIVIDQFEEIFTLCHDDDERSHFVDLLLYASAVAGGQTIVVITMRADFFGKCAAIPTLAARLGERDVLVPPMDETELRRAIDEPAELVGLQFEKGLVDRIVDDLGTEPGALPLLQHTLLELFDGRRDRWLTIDRYGAIGGVRGAIAQRAEAIYADLTPDQQAAARRILLRLTEPGEGTEDTRRRATFNELLPTGASSDSVETVVNRLADARLVVTSESDSGEEIVDVSHEALIRGWPRLQAWIEENPAALRVHRRLTETATEWAAAERDPSYLFAGQRLDEASAWASANPADLNELERDLLAASQAQRDKEQRSRRNRLRLAIGGTVLSMLLIGTAAVVAVANWQQAEESQREVFARLLASEGQRIAAEQPTEALRYEVEAFARAPADSKTSEDLRDIVVAQLATGTVASLGSVVTHAWPSPDGRFVVAVGEDEGSIWQLVGPRPRKLAGLPTHICDVLYPPGSDVGIATIEYGLNCANATALVFEVRRLADGAIVATGRGPTLPLGDATAHAHVVSTVGHSELISKSDGRPLGSAKFITTLDGADRAVLEGDDSSRLVSMTDGTLLNDLGHVEPVADPANGSVVAGRSPDGSCTLWSSADGRKLITIRSSCDRLQLSRDASLAVVWSKAGGVIVDVATGRALSQLDRTVWNVVFSPAAQPKSLAVLRTGDGVQLRRPDGSTIFSYGEILTDYEIENGARVEFSPDGRLVFLDIGDDPEGVTEGESSLRSTVDGANVALPPKPGDGGDHPSLSNVTFSPDPEATYIEATYGNGSQRLFRTADLAPLDFGDEESSSIEFLPPPVGILLHALPEGGFEALRWKDLQPLGKLPGGELTSSEIYSNATLPFAELAFDEYSTEAVQDTVLLGADGSIAVLGPGLVDLSIDDKATWFINDGAIWARLPTPHRITAIRRTAAIHQFDPSGRWLLLADPTNREAYILDVDALSTMSSIELDRLSRQDLVNLVCAGPAGEIDLNGPDFQVPDLSPVACVPKSN